MVRRSLIVFFLLLATPAFAQTKLQTDIGAVLQKLSVDAATALADANDHGDKIAAACYSAIVEVADAKIQAQRVTGGGLLLAFQKLRDLTRLNATPQGTNLIIGCAPLVQDAKLNMIDFFAKIGGTVLVKGLLIP